MTIEKAVRAIEQMKRKIATLEASVERASAKKLKSDRKRVAALVKKLGYSSVDHLFAAVRGKSPAVSVVAVKKRKRAKITPADRKSIVADLKRGGLTAGAIAKKHGVSIPSVNKIKHDAGLTRDRKAKVGKKKMHRKKAKSVARSVAPKSEGGSTTTPAPSKAE